MKELSRDKAIPKLIQVFQHYGYEGATLAKLSEATGLGKASLYHHFPKGKEEMASAVLEYLDRGLNEQLLAPLQQVGDPKNRLLAVIQNIDAFYDHGQKDCLLGLLSIGEARELFGQQIARSLTVWIDRLAKLAIESNIPPNAARQRAEDAVLQIQGALVLSRGLNDTTIFRRVLKQLPEMLLSPPSSIDLLS
jgi:TetR/AcrR family transcriptional regulator, lmrAB and yxaGH operons repressor